MRIKAPTFILLLFSFSAFSQTGVTGTTKNEAGEILPFSTVYIKGTSIGTTSNASGSFFLKTPPDDHIIVAQHVGYGVLERAVSISEGTTLSIDFTFKEQALQLKTVVVTAEDEDPAYRVIREAMQKRTFYENEVNAFKADAYLKGLFRLDERPEQILGQKITIDTGIIYLSESVSKFSFEKPDKVSETMISFNQASDFNINAYSKNIDLNMERVYVSPISGQAFLFYDYELLGVFEENERLINKIKLLPKRSTDPVFEGTIYIVEDEWRFHSIDLLVTKKRGLEFIDSLKINQVLAPVDYDIRMPLSQKYSFQFGTFGFKGSGYYIGLFSNYEIEPNYDLYKKASMYQKKFNPTKDVDLFQKKDFTAEVLKVEEGSNERDSTYWEKIRPVPLTAIEVEDYRVKDSIRVVKESTPYKDSVDAEKNKLTLGNILLSGYSHSNSIKEQYWSTPSVPGLFQYNTIEGFVPEVQVVYRKEIKERTKYWISPSIRYGFSNERFNAKLEGSYRKLDDKFTRFYAGGGRYISQFNEEGVITPFINSYLTLLSGDNYLKIFEKSFAYARFQQEVKNGILFTGNLEYASRDTLTNTTEYTWAKAENTSFTSNQPFNRELAATGFDTHQALIATVRLQFRIKQKYATRPDGKIIYPSEYPKFIFTYKKALKVFGADLDYDFAELRITDELPLGLVGTSNWAIAGGGFLNKNELTFVDFRHFAGNQINFSQTGRIFKFELLPFYEFSTSNSFIEAHYEHHFNEFIFNKIPLIKKLNLQAVGSANYLYTNTVGDYIEAGVGIEHIFKFLRLDYYWAYRNGDFFARGYRIGVGF